MIPVEFSLAAILGGVLVSLSYASAANALVGLAGTARSFIQWARHYEEAPPSDEEEELLRIAPIASLVQQRVLSRIVIAAVLAVAVTIGAVKVTDEIANSDELEVTVNGLVVVVASSPALAISRRSGPMLDEDEEAILEAYKQRYERFIASEVSKLRPLRDPERLVLEELRKQESSKSSVWQAIGKRNDPSRPTERMIKDAIEHLVQTGDIQLSKGFRAQHCKITAKGRGRLEDNESQRSEPPPTN